MVNSKLDYNIGYQLAIENSFKLLKIAEKAAEENEFGIACSLTVLSAEEIVKAGFINTQHYFPNVQITDFYKIFKRHDFKHYYMKNYLTVNKVMLDTYKKMDSEYGVLVDMLPDDTRANLDIILDLKKKVKDLERNPFDLEDAFKWIEGADNDKKNGFYIGIEDNAWHSPKSINREKFDIARKYTLILLDFVTEMEKSFIVTKGFV